MIDQPLSQWLVQCEGALVWAPSTTLTTMVPSGLSSLSMESSVVELPSDQIDVARLETRTVPQAVQLPCRAGDNP